MLGRDEDFALRNLTTHLSAYTHHPAHRPEYPAAVGLARKPRPMATDEGVRCKHQPYDQHHEVNLPNKDQRPNILHHEIVLKARRAANAVAINATIPEMNGNSSGTIHPAP